MTILKRGRIAGGLVVFALIVCGFTKYALWSNAEARRRAEAEQQVRRHAEELAARIQDRNFETQKQALLTLVESAARDGTDTQTFQICVPTLIGIVIAPGGRLDLGLPLEALEVLARRHPRQVIPLVVRRFSDENRQARITASYVLLKHCSLERPDAAETAAPYLVAALTDAGMNWDTDFGSYIFQALVKIGPVAVPDLSRALLAESAYARKQAVKVLHEIAPHAAAAVPALIVALQDSELPVKQTAISALGKIGPAAKDAMPHLIPLLTDPPADPGYWNSIGPAAAQSLTLIDPTWTTTVQANAVLPAILEQLKSRTMSVRYSATNILGHYADRHRVAVVPALLSAAVDEVASVRESVRLYEIDTNWFKWPEAKAGLPVLLRALNGTNTDASVAAARTLGLFVPAVPEATTALLTATTDKRGEVQAAALERLGERKPPAAQMVPAMIAALKDASPGTRELVAKNLGVLGAEAKAAVPALAEVVNQTPAAFDALWRIEPNWMTSEVGKRTVRRLVTDLSDKSAVVRKGAVDALRAFGPAAKDAAPDLIARLTDPDVWPGSALEQLDPNWGKSDAARRAVPDIAAGLKLTDPKVRERAVSVLQGLGPLAKDAVPALRAYLNDAEAKHQYAVIEAIQAIGPAAKDAVPDLVKKLAPRENNLRGSAHAALGKIDPKWASSPAVKEVIPVLVGEAKSHDLQTRMAAVESLGWIGPVSEEVRQVLAAALKDAEPGVRRMAVVAIGNFGLEEEPLLDKAVPLQNDPDTSVQEATREAIRKHQGRRIKR